MVNKCLEKLNMRKRFAICLYFFFFDCVGFFFLTLACLVLFSASNQVSTVPSGCE